MGLLDFADCRAAAYPVVDGANAPVVVMATLRERCRQILVELRSKPFGEAVDDLVAFAVAEKGRAADDALRETLPVCVYFLTDKDRENFISLVHELKPNMTTKRMP